MLDTMQGVSVKRGRFHIVILYDLTSGPKRGKKEKESKYHFNKNLKEPIKVFLWECKCTICCPSRSD